jgi:very-short-patch-repair endonuclease
MSKSDLEDTLVWQLKTARLPTPVEEYVFHRPRRWRFDVCWPDRKLAVEVEGGTWMGGRHTRGAGFEKDAEKYNQAALDGWTVLRYTSKHITSGWALHEIEGLFRE